MSFGLEQLSTVVSFIRSTVREQFLGLQQVSSSVPRVERGKKKITKTELMRHIQPSSDLPSFSPIQICQRESPIRRHHDLQVHPTDSQ
jgi:hypothetical protein